MPLRGQSQLGADVQFIGAASVVLNGVDVGHDAVVESLVVNAAAGGGGRGVAAASSQAARVSPAPGVRVCNSRSASWGSKRRTAHGEVRCLTLGGGSFGLKSRYQPPVSHFVDGDPNDGGAVAVGASAPMMVAWLMKTMTTAWVGVVETRRCSRHGRGGRDFLLFGPRYHDGL